MNTLNNEMAEMIGANQQPGIALVVARANPTIDP
jgi:hypothetical protein